MTWWNQWFGQTHHNGFGLALIRALRRAGENRPLQFDPKAQLLTVVESAEERLIIELSELHAEYQRLDSNARKQLLQRVANEWMNDPPVLPARDQEMSPAMRKATQLLEKGATEEAEAYLIRAVREAAAEHGPHSHEYAIAQNDLGRVLLALGNEKGALIALREACAVDVPDDEQATRDRLTFLLNLACLLEQNGLYDEADQVHKEGVSGRRKFYPMAHPGIAFGLEPYALFKLARGEVKAAARLIQETVTILREANHARLATALAIQAMVQARGGKVENLFTSSQDLNDVLFGEMVQTILARLDLEQAAVSRALLNALCPIVSQRLGESHDLLVQLFVARSNVERVAADQTERLAALRQIQRLSDLRREPRLLVESLLGQALAHGDAKNLPAAEAAYQQAIECSEKLGDVNLLSQVLRNYGLMLAEENRRGDAEPLLRQAVRQARPTKGDESLGRAEIALGIFLQHGGDLEEARKILSRALKRLPSSHPDALCGRSHIDAIDNGGSCGCGDISGAFAASFRETVLANLPRGVVEDIRMVPADDGFHIDVRVARQPTPDEREQIERVIRHAEQRFRDQMRLYH